MMPPDHASIVDYDHISNPSRLNAALEALLDSPVTKLGPVWSLYHVCEKGEVFFNGALKLVSGDSTLYLEVSRSGLVTACELRRRIVISALYQKSVVLNEDESDSQFVINAVGGHVTITEQTRLKVYDSAKYGLVNLLDALDECISSSHRDLSRDVSKSNIGLFNCLSPLKSFYI